MKHTLKFLGR